MSGCMGERGGHSGAALLQGSCGEEDCGAHRGASPSLFTQRRPRQLPGCSGHLSTMKPALEKDLETHLLRAVLHSVFTLGTEKDTTYIQALHKVMSEVLDAMLGNLLAESPDRLDYILEHVNFWIVSRVSQERARAIRSSTALLRYTVTLPEFDISAEFPRMGHHAAQLALFVSDPDKDSSRQARKGTYRLDQLLLQQWGLTIHEAEDLWCSDWHQDSRLLAYKNTARVGESLAQPLTQICAAASPAQREVGTDDLILSNQATGVPLRLRWRVPCISGRGCARDPGDGFLQEV
ncbi:uncharacterized protein LOC122456608 [Dermochelys coriacea]|uniref:uncharacterized protein LOC122456608 n=1 Tax=Dermochelys coriacea TaxID=27794 RepID=UPI001CA9375A|nr:uncharacterized protein LOC122456608 [Dermochelys coriacea]